MNFFKRIGAAFHSRTGAYIFYSLTVLAFAMLRSAKWAYWFIAEMYPLGDKFVPTLFAVIGICAAATVAFLIMGKRIKSRALRAAHTVICVLAGIMFGYTVVLSFGLDNGFQLNSILTGISNLLSILLPIAVALALPLPFAVFRKHKNAARASLAMLAIVPAAFLVYNFVISPLVYSRMSFTPSREPEAAVAEKHSIADYKILYGKDASPAETNAAEILAGCLKQITGMDYKAEQAEPTGTKEILIGQISGLDTSGLGEEGYIIEPEGDTILISGGRPRGTLYGVFHFLENYFGFRRYTRDLYVIPEAAAEIAEVVAEKYVPPMEYRQTEWLTRVINDDYSFRVANRINDNVSSGDYPPEWGGSIGYYGPFCHTFTSWLLPANEYFEKHPEW
ncbi:MAG: hypothetical protein FWF08_09890, partial [Oscillospiraceae bacterium]|nr:hypothetical protein [Oscillospiraceae bacterium]